MKTTFIKFTLATLLASLASIGFVSTAMATTKITVNGMVCAFCAQGIEKRISKMPATKSVLVDLKSKIVAVEAKDGMQLDAKALTFEITEAGYDVVKIEASQQTVAQIKASLKGQK
jgi:copper chaperone CopZ